MWFQTPSGWNEGSWIAAGLLICFDEASLCRVMQAQRTV